MNIVETSNNPSDKKTGLLPAVRSHDHAEIRMVLVSIFEDCFGVHLSDGRMIAVPYFWFPRLADASHSQRLGFEIRQKGFTLWWDELDEVLHVDGILEGKADMTKFALEWRKEHGYEWFDSWYFYNRLNDEQRQNLTGKNTVKSEVKAPVYRAADLLEILATEHKIKLSKQRLHQITYGETQKKGGKEYRIEPRLSQDKDFVLHKKTARYTEQGLQKVRELYAVK